VNDLGRLLRSLARHIGYLGGSLSLFTLVILTLGVWYWSLGSVSIETVTSPKVEAFYWATIMFSQTLGTALGDWMADTGLGYHGSALVIAVALTVVLPCTSSPQHLAPCCSGPLSF
jgi:uncharacterized membrane-anchored protein